MIGRRLYRLAKDGLPTIAPSAFTAKTFELDHGEGLRLPRAASTASPGNRLKSVHRGEPFDRRPRYVLLFTLRSSQTHGFRCHRRRE